MTKKEIPTRTDVFDGFLQKPEEAPIAAAGIDASAWFERPERKPRRIAMTFTLDPKVIALIEKTAEKNKMSRSRVLETLALKVLR